MIDSTRQEKLDDPVVLDTISTVLSGFIAVWDEPTKQTIQECTTGTVSTTTIENEVLYLRAFAIVFILGQQLGETKIKSAVLDRFHGRVAHLLPDVSAFLDHAADYASALEASGPDDVGSQIGVVFGGHCGRQGDTRLASLGEKQYAALSLVIPQFLIDATS